MRTKPHNTLGVDRGSKYVWLAYEQGDTQIVFPIWYMMNDKDIMWQMWQFLTQYRIGHIVMWWPRDERTQKLIKPFVEQLTAVAGDKIEIEYANEDYTSVQAGERSGNFQKNMMEDTIAAMIILERWRESQG